MAAALTSSMSTLATGRHRGRIAFKRVDKKNSNNNYAFVEHGGGSTQLYAWKFDFSEGFYGARVDDTVEYDLGKNGKGETVAVKVNVLCGWRYSRKLDPKTHRAKFKNDEEAETAAKAFRQAGVAAIHELRRQYIVVMRPEIGAPEEARILFYKSATAKGCKQAYLWTAEDNKTDVQTAVLGVRYLVERLCYFSKKDNPEKYLTDNDAARWRIVAHRVLGPDSLLRTVNGPVQWSAHGELNPYHYTEVDEGSILEIVEKLVEILEVLFKGRPKAGSVKPRAVYTALVAAFKAPSILEKDKANNDEDGRRSKQEEPLKVFKGKLKELGAEPPTPTPKTPKTPKTK